MNPMFEVKQEMKKQIAEKQIHFNEEELETYLKNDQTTKLYQLEFLTGSFHTIARFSICKISCIDPDLSMILKLDAFYNDLSVQKFNKCRDCDFQLFGFYSKKLNALILRDEHFYHSSDLIPRCHSIRIFIYESLVIQFRQETEQFFRQQYPMLKEQYQNEEKIQSLGRQYEREFYKDAVTGVQKQFLDHHHFVWASHKNPVVVDYEVMFHYIANPTECIEDYCARYLKTGQGERQIKETVCYYLARERAMLDLSKDPMIKKIQRIYRYLKKELVDAKKIWLLGHDGKKKQVENKLDIDLNNTKIGGWSDGWPMEKVKAIQYGRDIFTI